MGGSRGSGPAREGRAPRRLFLAGDPGSGEPELLPEDAEHGRRVLRLRPGDELVGLDGRGGVWPLVVVDGPGRDLRVAAAGAPHRDPAPGAPGAPLPRLELATAVPRGGRAEELLDRLVQLGVDAWQPLAWERSHPGARDLGGERRRRLERVAREACKQSGRTWLPRVGPLRTVEEHARQRAQDAVCRLEPGAARRLGDWLASPAARRAGRGERTLSLWVGPEGGPSEAERALLDATAWPEAWLAPHVLRVETAAEAAAAVAVHALGAPA